MAKKPSATPEREGTWTFLSNHAHVLLALARDPTARLRDVAQWVGITERAVQKIVAELEAGGYLTRTREGRRNRYQIHSDRPLRHPAEAHHPVADLLAALLEPGQLQMLGRRGAGARRGG